MRSKLKLRQTQTNTGVTMRAPICTLSWGFLSFGRYSSPSSPSSFPSSHFIFSFTFFLAKSIDVHRAPASSSLCVCACVHNFEQERLIKPKRNKNRAKLLFANIVGGRNLGNFSIKKE